MIAVYFIADREQRDLARGIADVFMSPDDIRYDVIKNVVRNGRTAIAFGNADTFVAVDDFLCAEGLYDSGNIEIFEGQGEFFEAYREEPPVSVFTDDLDFVRQLRATESAAK